MKKDFGRPLPTRHRAPPGPASQSKIGSRDLQDLDFDELYRVFAMSVWQWAVRLGATGPDAQDVTQEVFVVAHRRFAAFQLKGSLDYAPWLFGLTRRVVDNQRKAEKRLTRVAEQYTELAEKGVDPRPEQRLDRRQALERFNRALQGLREAERTAFILYEVEELPGKEAAELMALPLSNFRTHLYRARQKLMKRLRALEVFDGKRSR